MYRPLPIVYIANKPDAFVSLVFVSNKFAKFICEYISCSGVKLPALYGRLSNIQLDHTFDTF